MAPRTALLALRLAWHCTPEASPAASLASSVPGRCPASHLPPQDAASGSQARVQAQRQQAADPGTRPKDPEREGWRGAEFISSTGSSPRPRLSPPKTEV